MSDVDDRWFKTDQHGRRVPSARNGTGARWLARWRDEHGKQRSKAFGRKLDAERHLAAVASDLARGNYVDPNAGRVTLDTYASDWLAAQTFDPATREAVDRRLRNVILPHLGRREVRAIRPSHVQTWIRAVQQQERAAQAIRIAFGNLQAILDAAVDDKLIAQNPCKARSVRPPAPDRTRLVPWTDDRVAAVVAALPAKHRAVAVAAAGLGLRQGEVLGLAVDDIDFLRGEVNITRQIKYIGHKLVYGPPKGGKSRTVPLPESVKLALAAHLQQFPAAEVELPWLPPGKPDTMTARLLFHNGGNAWRGAVFNLRVWRPALRAAGVEDDRHNGMHACRHYYASTLLEGGVSIRALADFLGHHDPAFTLRTYAHLMPTSADRAREAVDASLTACAPNVNQGATAHSV